MMVLIVVGVMAGLLAVVGLVALFRWTVGEETEFQATADRLVRPMEAPLFQEGMRRPVRVLRDGARLLVELE
ncbi:hypothetical protein NVS55_11105 [Myxococcus stipitatus]|uniref:hypothetical protein n=1 Tax=Myxococcus stipitatus TaxID=83455 RepID=UPI0031453128